LPSSHPAGGSVQGGTLYGHGRPLRHYE
jgi:hypothetical protein